MDLQESLTVTLEWLQLNYGQDTYDICVRLRHAWTEAEQVSMDAGYLLPDRFGNLLYTYPAHAPPPLFERVMEAIRRGAAAEEGGPMLM